VVGFLLGAATVLPLFGQTTAPVVTDSNDFGQYVVSHQDILGPFFSKNAGDFFRLAIPALLGIAGWMIFIDLAVDWGFDVVLSRVYAAFFAPAFVDWKRSIIYATGSLFLSFVFIALMGLAIVLGLSQAQPWILFTLIILVPASIVAQVVWIIYVYRTGVFISILFCIALSIVHGFASSLITQPLIAQPIMGSRAAPDITNFVDNVITPRLQAETQATRHELATVTGGRDSAQAKVNETQDEITQAESEQATLTREIEEKKNSDIGTLAQLINARAQGELATAREGLAAFPSKFPGSLLEAQARAQLTAVDAQIAAADAQRKQEEANEARAVATARADLLAKAVKGQATLSEMRHALIGQNRAAVSSLLGPPSDTASDQWNYRQRMILNPLTSEQTGLTVYFNEGVVQSVDYNRGAF
jgi:hypothetical protein